MKKIIKTTKLKTDKNSKLFLFFLISIITPMFIFGQIKTSIANGNWNNALIWSPSGVPTSSDKINIYHSVSLNVNFSCSDTIFVYNTLSIAANKTLSLSPGTMVLVNNSSYDGRIGSVGNNGKILGDFTFQKWVTRCDGSSTYGSPFDALTSDFDWYYCYQCMGPSWSNLYYYDETTLGTLDLGYYDNIGGSIQRGKGFFYWFSNYSGGQNFPRQIELKGNIDFTQNFNFNITKTTSNGLTEDGYNLVSNPFPGTIDWLATGWTKTRVQNAVYVWNSCTDSYSSYVGGVGVNGGSQYIPSMQGFWVHANANNPILKVKAKTLVSNSQNLLKTNWNNDTVNYVLRLKLNNDEIAIRIDSSSTNSLDSLTDALKFYSDNSFISSTNYADSLDYAVNAIKDTNSIIPIKVKGAGTISFNGVPTFFNQYSIYLKDLVNLSFLPVTENMQYTYSDTSTVSYSKRFEIHFIKNVVTSVKNQLQNEIKISFENNDVVITFKNNYKDSKITFYDFYGKLLLSNSYNEENIIIKNAPNPSILKVQNSDGFVTKKIFLK